MNPIEQDPRVPGSGQTIADLERLAGRLDSLRHPGTAWTADVRGVRRWPWKIAGSIAAVAALLAIAFHLWHVPSAMDRKPDGPIRIASTRPAPRPAADDSPPRIVIIEDNDSYSIIDLTNDIPLVSFASKDAPNLDETTPVLLDGNHPL